MKVRRDNTTPRRLAIIGSRGYPSTYGGYETLVRYLAKAWVERGHDVTVYCRDQEEGKTVWERDGVTCRWTPGHDSKSLSTLSFGMSSQLDAARRGFDAALVLNIANGFFLPALKAAGIATAVNTDGIEWKRGKWGSAAKRVFFAGAKATARHADLLIADSQAIADIWRQTFDAEATFIPYGAPVLHDECDHRVRAVGLVPGEYALVVARLIPENNVELILDGLDRLDQRPPIVVVGSANFDSALEGRLRDLDHHGAVRWLGHVHDQELLTQLWANCGVYLHGHSVGGTNPALLQALGAGAPTLALDTCFNREVIGADDQLFPAEPGSLAEKIGATLASPVRQAAMAEHGREVIGTRYVWEDIIDRYYEALVEAVARRSGGRSRDLLVPAGVGGVRVEVGAGVGQ
jgi:glycosyltransferase involved in cell wall biosynthesis